jgi:hypothetical protein
MHARTFAIAGAAGAASAVAFALLRMKRPRTPAAASAVAFALGRTKRPRAAGPVEAAEPETYRCDCGQGFRVAGAERHRVYWLADAAEDDPVLSQSCPACDRPLPRETDVAAAA